MRRQIRLHVVSLYAEIVVERRTLLLSPAQSRFPPTRPRSAGIIVRNDALNSVKVVQTAVGIHISGGTVAVPGPRNSAAVCRAGVGTVHKFLHIGPVTVLYPFAKLVDDRNAGRSGSQVVTRLPLA